MTFPPVKRIRAGFTLIELLVVIAIIGLLASIILAALSGAQAKGRDARRIGDIREIQNALELYIDTCKSFPNTSPLTLSENNGCPAGVTLGTFLPSLPTDPHAPAANANYLYTAYGSGNPCIATSYHLGADFEVGQTVGSTAAAKAGACSTPSGAYNGNSGNGNGTVAINSGDFNPGTVVGGWVYAVTP
jgi:prepilin-type N-terminal cleavage/methylation domain-containing protein